METTPPYTATSVSMLDRHASTDVSRMVAEEVPISITYNGIAHVVMMITPIDMQDFAIGFSLSEGIIGCAKDIKSMDIRLEDDGYIADLWINETLQKNLLDKRRNLVGQTGCGICGVAELGDVHRTYPKVKAPPRYSRDQLFDMVEKLVNHQVINKQTGAVHAAAYVDNNGTIDSVREDVGRHNALDKLIGYCEQQSKNISGGAIILTSRCSFELVQKAIAAKAPMLITISVPTSMAVKIAKAHDLTLICLARSDNMLVFNDPFSYFEDM